MILDLIIPKLLEHCDPTQEEEGGILSKRLEEAEKKLSKDFTEEQRTVFKQYLEAVTAYHCFELEYLEKICFSLGINMMAEVNQEIKHPKTDAIL